jgi:hypothetical protein
VVALFEQVERHVAQVMIVANSTCTLFCAQNSAARIAFKKVSSQDPRQWKRVGTPIENWGAVRNTYREATRVVNKETSRGQSDVERANNARKRFEEISIDYSTENPASLLISELDHVYDQYNKYASNPLTDDEKSTNLIDLLINSENSVVHQVGLDIQKDFMKLSDGADEEAKTYDKTAEAARTHISMKRWKTANGNESRRQRGRGRGGGNNGKSKGAEGGGWTPSTGGKNQDKKPSGGGTTDTSFAASQFNQFGKGNGKGGGKGGGKGKGNDGGKGKKQKEEICFRCKQPGHWARNCPNPASAQLAKKVEQAQAALDKQLAEDKKGFEAEEYANAATWGNDSTWGNDYYQSNGGGSNDYYQSNGGGSNDYYQANGGGSNDYHQANRGGGNTNDHVYDEEANAYNFDSMEAEAELTLRAHNLMDVLQRRGPQRERWIKEYVSKGLEDRRAAESESECFDETSNVVWSDQIEGGQAEETGGEGQGEPAKARDGDDQSEGSKSSRPVNGWEAAATKLPKGSNGSGHC